MQTAKTNEKSSNNASQIQELKIDIDNSGELKNDSQVAEYDKNANQPKYTDNSQLPPHNYDERPGGPPPSK